MVQGSERQTMLTLGRTKMQIQGQSSLLPQALLTLVQVTKLENVKKTLKISVDQWEMKVKVLIHLFCSTWLLPSRGNMQRVLGL